MPQSAFGNPLLGQARGGRKPVIEVNAIAHAHFPGPGHHLFGVGNRVGNGLFAQNVTAGIQGLHRRGIVIATVLVAAGRHAHHVGFQLVEHFLYMVKARHAQPLRTCIGTRFVDVAHANEL